MDVWKCGHPKTPENTKDIGSGVRCRTCRRQIELKASRKRRTVQRQLYMDYANRLPAAKRAGLREDA